MYTWYDDAWLPAPAHVELCTTHLWIYTTIFIIQTFEHTGTEDTETLLAVNHFPWLFFRFVQLADCCCVFAESKAYLRGN